ncbi:MAG: hypothetical protein WCO49_06900 [Nostocales cyanobacterium ELA608]|jgi:hypothetical protein|nr:MAG: hypothetical protein AN488_11790 [Anabaena sp. WA113]
MHNLDTILKILTFNTSGSDYIHLYVDDIEGDWLENWDWKDDLTDYIDAFYHHCEVYEHES